MRRVQWSRAACCALIFMGCLGVPAKMLGLRKLTHVLRFVGISPMPEPYRLVSFTGRYPKGGIFYQCEAEGGARVTTKFDAALRSRLHGPHGRGIVFLEAHLRLSRLWFTPADEAVFRYGWCHDGPLAKAAGCPAHVKGVRIFVKDRAGERTVFERWVPCTS